MIPRLLLIFGLLLAQPGLAAACAPQPEEPCCCCEQPAVSCCEMDCREEAAGTSEAALPAAPQSLILAALPHEFALLTERPSVLPDTSGHRESFHSPPRRYLLDCSFRL